MSKIQAPRLGLSAKIVLGNCVFLVILAFATVFMHTELQGVNQAASRQMNALASQEQVNATSLKFGELRSHLGEFSRNWGDQPLSQARTTAQDLQQRLQTLQADTPPTSEMPLSERATAYMDAMIASVEEQVGGNRLESNRIAKVGQTHATAIEKQLQILLNDASNRASESGAAVTQANKRIVYVMWGSMSIVLIVSLVCSGLIGTWIARRIRAVSTALHNMSEGEGDLTQRLPLNSRDEIRDLSENFNSFVERIQTLIISTREQVLTVSGSADQLSDTASELSQGAQQTNHESASS